MKKPLFILLFILLFSPFLQAQKNVTTQNVLWMRYYLKLEINDNWRIRQEVEERMYWFPLRQHQFLARTHAERKIGKGWQAAAGFTYFLQSLPHDPEVSDFRNRTELRPQVELSNTQEISKKVKLQHRYWTEFRIFEQHSDGFAFGNFRSRYKIGVSYSPIEKLTFKAFDEIFLQYGKNIGLNIFDQNRIGASVQYNPAKNLGVELGYFNWYQQRSSGVDFFNRHIVRITIRHTIALNKQ